MIVSEICEYLDSRLKVPTEINGFLLSIDASLNQKQKIENLILWCFMIILWYYDIQRILWISRLSVEGSNWNERILLSIDASLYQKPKIEKLILW